MTRITLFWLTGIPVLRMVISFYALVSFYLVCSLAQYLPQSTRNRHGSIPAFKIALEPLTRLCTDAISQPRCQDTAVASLYSRQDLALLLWLLLDTQEDRCAIR